MNSKVMIRRLGEAEKMVKAMGGQGFVVQEDYRGACRETARRVLQEQMQAKVSAHLEQCRHEGAADRRNGSYGRSFLTEVGAVELRVPRTRAYAPVEVLRGYARRSEPVNRVILAAFVLGVSTRKVAKVLLPLLGEKISPDTVSQIAKTLDAAVASFHRRGLQDRYRALLLDGVALNRKTGAGAVCSPVLVALGILPDGNKEVIDFRQAHGESQTEWEALLHSLYQRGLSGAGLEVISVDGGKGLLAALPLIYPHVPVQRCWAHKARNVLGKCRKADWPAVKKDLHRIHSAPSLVLARAAARRFAARWQGLYPKAVACLRVDLDQLLTCYRFHDPDWRKRIRTTNLIERCFVEVRRRTRPMGVFFDQSSVERILYAVFTHFNQCQGHPVLFPLTQNS
jgi:transposase-like protein